MAKPKDEDRVLANSYVTGHKPKETLAELIARCNANSFLGDMPDAPKASKPEKKHKVTKAAENLTREQLLLVLQLANGERASLVCDGETYAVLKLADGSWSVCSLADPKEYIVVGSNCTCEDSKYRQRECKHVRALETLR